jgi:hypothetical protein
MTDFNPITNCPKKNLYNGFCNSTYCECRNILYPPGETTDGTSAIRAERRAGNDRREHE